MKIRYLCVTDIEKHLSRAVLPPNFASSENRWELLPAEPSRSSPGAFCQGRKQEEPGTGGGAAAAQSLGAPVLRSEGKPTGS